MNETVKSYILESFREKYHRAGKKDKGAILEELCERFFCHRKHAIRLMRRKLRGRKPEGKRRGAKPR